MSYTKGIWKISKHGECNIEGDKDRSICSTGGYQSNTEDSTTENLANAQHIVECVNGWDDLKKESNDYLVNWRQSEKDKAKLTKQVKKLNHMLGRMLVITSGEVGVLNQERLSTIEKARKVLKS